VKLAAPALFLKPLAACAALATLTLAAPHAMAQEKTLRIAMTAADIPRTLGQPDQGFEGNRFTGIPMYDSLTHWDLSRSDAPSVLIPGVATAWAVDAKDKTKWVFKLRKGVKFHDGSDFDADAVVWNVRKVFDKDAPQFDASQVGVTASRMPTLKSARKIDDMTVELVHQRARCLPADQPVEPVHGQPGALAEKVRCRRGRHARRQGQGRLDRLRRRCVGLGPVQDDALRGARAARAGRQQDLLGSQARTEDRQGRDDPDARGQRAHRRPAGRPGRLDRGAVARCHRRRSTQRGFKVYFNAAAARVAVAAVVRRRLALARQARALRGQPVHRPRRHEASCWAA
jgi:hypothetical protein